VRATLDQVDALDLGEGAVAAAAVLAPEGRSVGRGIWDILDRAIDRHQAQPKAERAQRLGRGNGLGEARVQQGPGPHPALVAAVDERARPRQAIGRIRPDEAQALGEFAQHVAQRQVRGQVHGDERPDRHFRGQLTGALAKAVAVHQHRLAHLPWHNALQGVHGQFPAEVALGVHLTYRVSHEVAPWLLGGLCNRKYARAAASLLM
jgi:hypothetical protein